MSSPGITLWRPLALVLLLPLAASSPTPSELLPADEDAHTFTGFGATVPACFLNALQLAAKARDSAGARGQSAHTKISLADKAGARSLMSPSRRGTSAKAPTGGAIKVLGAGLPKTGTSSLHLALRRLGYHSVHGEFLELSSFSEMWTEWGHGNPWPVINKMLAMGYDAASDRPWCFFYEEFLQLNPNLKVILTRYPSGAEEWVKSLEHWTTPLREKDPRSAWAWWNSTSGQAASNSVFRTFLNCTLGFPPHNSWGAEQREACTNGYLEWYRRVRASVPPHQLLEYKITQGWQPLCTFLNVKNCPHEPFPMQQGPVGMAIKDVAHDVLQSVRAVVGLPHKQPFLNYDVFAPRHMPKVLTLIWKVLR